MDYFDNSSILITGGTGSLGKSLIAKLLTESSARRIAIYSRDELKQLQLKALFGDNPRLRWFLGDIRDLERMKRAMHGVDFVIHAAALKQVDTGEYNPMEFIKTNVLGSQNVIEAAIDCGVKKVVALSTDKASSPINLYGATKLTADKLFIAANNYSQGYGTAFSVVRYGNVMGSRGSVIPLFRDLSDKKKPLPITDFRMTRFLISLNMASNFVLDSFGIMQGGELYVPRIPSIRIVDLAKAISGESELVEVGIRPGEKLHEEMISQEDIRRTIQVSPERLVVLPTVTEYNFSIPAGIFIEDEHAYASNTNNLWMSEVDLKKYIEEIGA
ncbi:UDP-N-acetylglucosamine 4,6-dehydratase [Candidatus Planktophila versatilis]|uniref:UDP-N-acetylglucosamine 4,6-dehydratase n=1 Tax=Candidatus Planktophila versatilis TaxID=1884905 RepID=A0AAC9YWD7_9ACTN|nr:UDP-N-acetylglucosamine 4,6-dehydratase (inverting) [Candidatus Planktophila versatilis]ASY22039.1 UDP-N-acetylglucosamine 4,6-dehydratase [Candidatus Planktophila versatilis]